jgi:hypothetical protein
LKVEVRQRRTLYRSNLTELSNHLHLSMSSAINTTRYLPVPDSSHRTRPRTLSDSASLLAYQGNGENVSIVRQGQQKSTYYQSSGHEGTILASASHRDTLRSINWTGIAAPLTIEWGLQSIIYQAESKSVVAVMDDTAACLSEG